MGENGSLVANLMERLKGDISKSSIKINNSNYNFNKNEGIIFIIEVIRKGWFQKKFKYIMGIARGEDQMPTIYIFDSRFESILEDLKKEYEFRYFYLPYLPSIN